MKKLIMLIILSLIFSGCGKGPEKSTYYVTVTVQAIDMTTSLAVPEAVTIIENGPVGNTGGNGSTIFNNILGNKEYTFVTSANTYNINKKTVHIGNSNTTVTVTLNKLMGTITGFVVDEAEAPISADIRLVELNQNTTSDATTGEFSFTDVPVIDDPYSISVTKTGYNERIIGNLKLSATNLTASAGKIMLGNTPGTLTGRVTDMLTRIVQNVEVRIPETNQAVLTDTNGDYTLQIFPGSNYTAEFYHADYSPVVKTGIQIRPNQTTVLNVSLPVKGGSIFGVVRNSLNEPIPGALITVVDTGNNAFSGVDGSFRINDVQPGTYTVTITHELYNSTSVSASVSSNLETSLGNITLANKTGVIKGYLSEPNCTVTLIQTQNSQAFINPGYFTFNNVQPGTYYLKIEKNDYKSQILNVTVGSSETKDLGTISITDYVVGAPFGAETEEQTNSVTAVYDVGATTYIPYNVNATVTLYALGVTESVGHTISVYVELLNPYGQEILRVVSYNGEKPGSITQNMSLISGNYTCRKTTIIDYPSSIGSGYATIKWLKDIKIPKINFNMTWGSNQSSYNVIVNVEDYYLTNVQYVITDSFENPPDDAQWQDTTNGGTIVINQPGVNYLHVRANDISGKQGYRCEGPYIVD